MARAHTARSPAVPRSARRAICRYDSSFLLTMKIICFGNRPSVTLWSRRRSTTFAVHSFFPRRSLYSGWLYWYGPPNRAMRMSARVSGARTRSYSLSAVPRVAPSAAGPAAPSNFSCNCTTSRRPALIPCPMSGLKECAASPTSTTPHAPSGDDACSPGQYWHGGNASPGARANRSHSSSAIRPSNSTRGKLSWNHCFTCGPVFKVHRTWLGRVMQFAGRTATDARTGRLPSDRVSRGPVPLLRTTIKFVFWAAAADSSASRIVYLSAGTCSAFSLRPVAGLTQLLTRNFFAG
mmetsp:Transcript_31149/g.61681  ORF Transcript_31149/g.61681 Transcript_31149/m.61681 type:complete len:293 (+) Transcript_31149:94-972(+)